MKNDKKKIRNVNVIFQDTIVAQVLDQYDTPVKNVPVKFNLDNTSCSDSQYTTEENCIADLDCNDSGNACIWSQLGYITNEIDYSDTLCKIVKNTILK